MSKPNRAFAHLAKNPFDFDSSHATGSAAAERAKELKEQGFDVKVTMLRQRPSRIQKQRGNFKVHFHHRVWKRKK